MKSGSLNFLEPSGPLQACNGTALPLQQLGTGWKVRGLNPGGGEVSSNVQTGSGAHPASFAMSSKE